ncbi:MAG: N-acetylmuramoyl-L-alanine amidase [Coriobacteriales bacterium]|jgi:N-acetylmuramoyl-L-alanine amidase
MSYRLNHDRTDRSHTTARDADASQPPREPGQGETGDAGSDAAPGGPVLSRRTLALGAAGVVALGVAIGLRLSSCSQHSDDDPQPDNGDSSDASGNPSSQFSGGAIPVGDDGTLTVAIDPGHGGDDSGTEESGLVEADICWTVANYCVGYLEDHGVTVVLTRGRTTNPTLEDRTQVAVNAGADALLSVHINYNDQDPGLSGVTVYRPTDQTSYLEQTTTVPATALANNVIGELTAIGLNSNGAVSQELYIDPNDATQAKYAYPGDTSNVSDYYAMVRWPRKYGIPAVLVEHAFLSNEGDRELLSDDGFLKQMGEADARAILETAGYTGTL